MTYDQLKRWREAVGAMPASNDSYIRGVRRAGDALAERVATLEAVLTDARSVIALCDRSVRDPMLHDLADAIGRMCGYGALMSAAQHAWQERLKDGDPMHVPGGEFTCGPCRITVQQTLASIDAVLPASPASRDMTGRRMMDDNVTEFPAPPPREEWLCGPYEAEYRVILEGRQIPRLTGVRDADGQVWLCVDHRFMQPFTTDEDARCAAVLIAQAMAIGAGYSHYGSETKDRPFAPLAVEVAP